MSAMTDAERLDLLEQTTECEIRRIRSDRGEETWVCTTFRLYPVYLYGSLRKAIDAAMDQPIIAKQ